MEGLEEESYKRARLEAKEYRAEHLEIRRNIDLSIHNEFNIPRLKEIDSAEEVREDKIEKATIKAYEFVGKLQETVEHYLKKIKIEEFSVDPEIKLRQIRNAERMLQKMAEYLAKETNKNEDLSNNKLSYVEILEGIRDAFKSSIDKCSLI